MWLWLRMALAVVVLLAPGGFLLVLAWVTARTLRARRRLLQAQANGQVVPLRRVIATVQLRELVREARASL